MKALKNSLWLIAILLVFFVASPSSAYRIQLRFLSDNPMIFPLGPLVPGDLSNASDINFEDIEAFFEMYIEREPTDSRAPEDLTLLVRLETGDEILFTVTSLPFDVSPLVGRWLNNQEVSYIPNIHLGQGKDINYNRLIPYISGGNLRQGFYIITAILSEHSDWETAQNQN